MTPHRPGWATCWIALAVAAAILPACAFQDLNFRTDTRLTFQAPGDRETVTLPLTVSWTVDDFRVVEPNQGPPSDEAGYFAVFVDRTPQPPREPLDWLARLDPSCRASDGCPDQEYFAQRQVFVTTDTSFVVESLPVPTDLTRREHHRATIILLDTDGHRIGESAFSVDFQVERRSEPTAERRSEPSAEREVS